MDLSAILAAFEGFDIAKFLPELSTLLGWVETLLRLFVMAGPLLMLGFGLIYLLAPPKEANYSLGYRFFWSMASLEVWKFTHTLAGAIWSALGLVLTVLMAVICNGFRDQMPMDMIWSGVTCLLWELGLTVLSVLAVNIVVFLTFDRQGFRRGSFEN